MVEPEGKRPLGRYRHGWEVNIKTDFRERGWGYKGCIHLARMGRSGRLVYMLMKLSGAIKC
jgi:hypothetical protein